MTPPQTLLAGRYRLLAPIGQGGMGRVWLAEDEFLRRRVAVKEVVPPEGLSPTEVRAMGARALREAQTAARLSHPNVVTVYDIVVGDTAPWIVMEYLPSRSLFQMVTEDGPLPVAEAARIGLAVLNALRAAHSVEVLHRDVKPSNVLIEPSGRVVLTDFGLAVIVGDPSVTRSGVVIGSPSYMAPERARDADAGHAADLWSLGATVYFAVEGRSPYQRSTPLATVAALASENPDPYTRAGRLKPVLDGLLRRDPAARLKPAAIERMLRRAAADPRPRPAAGAVVAPPRPLDLVLAEARRHWRAVAAGFATLVLVVAGATWGLASVAGTPTADLHSPDAASPLPTVSGPSPSSEPSREPTPTPTSGPGPSPSAADQPLPPGWHTYQDSTGFSVAVPASWPVTREGTIVYFREPNGGRVLGIDQTNKPQPDPVADWTGKEEYRVARGDFPGYRRVRLEAVDYFVKAADWEFTYIRSGNRVHVNNRGFIVSPTRAYGMWWSTLDSAWSQHRADLEVIQRSFTPAR